MKQRSRSIALMCLLALAVTAREAAGATIFVTTLQQPGIGTGACSLQEAIYSSVLHDIVDIALGDSDALTCDAGDLSRDHQVTIDEILTAVDAALNGCPVT